MMHGCYKEGAKSKTFSVTIKSTEHKEQEVFQNRDDFKEKSKERVIKSRQKIVNSNKDTDVASSSGLIGMQMQGAMAIFSVNLMRIITLMKESK